MPTLRHLLRSPSAPRHFLREAQRHLVYRAYTDRAFVEFSASYSKTVPNDTWPDSSAVAAELNSRIAQAHESLSYGSSSGTRLGALEAVSTTPTIVIGGTGTTTFRWYPFGSSLLIAKPASWRNGTHRLYIYSTSSFPNRPAWLVLNDDPVHVPDAAALSSATAVSLPGDGSYLSIPFTSFGFSFIHLVTVPHFTSDDIPATVTIRRYVHRSTVLSRVLLN